MNIKEYIDNPMGKGSSVIPNRQLIQMDLSAKYNRLIAEKDIKLNIYMVNIKDYLFHLNIPSETDRGNYYDIVVQFYTNDKDVFRQSSLKNYDIRLFCNAPSFVYTYANAYKSQDMLVPYLTSKFEKEIFKKEPVMRNPYKVVSYEKYLFFAIKYILDDTRFMNKDIVEKMAKVYNPITFSKKIKSDTEVLLEIKKLEKKKKEEMKASSKHKDTRDLEQGKIATKTKKSTVNTITPKTKSTAKIIKPMKKVKKR